MFADYRPLVESSTWGDRVFFLGKPPALDRLLDDSPAAEIYVDGHWPVIKAAPFTATWAASWFGDGDYTAADCYHVWHTLGTLIAGKWRDSPGSALLFTPATTGRDLWLRTIPAGIEYPVLDDDLQRTIRTGAGQGRIEVLPAPPGHRGGPVTLHEYDATLAYLAVTRRMPIGQPVDLTDRAAENWWYLNEHQPARYLVTFQPPTVREWGHRPGVLPVLDRGPIGGWSWPTGSELHGPTWVEASELWIAHCHHWRFDIHRVIGWENTADVFRKWQRRLLGVIEAGRHVYRDDPARARMIRAACRAIALYAIGSLHGGPHRVSAVGSSPPANAQGIRYLPGSGRLAWHVDRPPAWPELVHPEWSTTIWGRARARLLDAPHATGALHLAPGTVAALRTDAIYTTQRADWPDVADDVGRYTYRGAIELPIWPTTGTDILAAKARR